MFDGQICFFSDHKYILLRICVTVSIVVSSVQHRKMSPGAVIGFRNCLMEEIWTGVYDGTLTAGARFQKFFNIFLYHFNNAFPLTTSTLKTRDNSWYTDDLRRSSVELRDLYHLSKETDNRVLRDAFRAKQTVYRREVGTAKRQYFENQIHNSHNKTKTTWNIIRLIHGGKRSEKKK